jgi:hypothetical protein
MAALLPQPDLIELLTPLLAGVSIAIVVFVITRVVALTRSLRARRRARTSSSSETVSDYPLNPLEERTTRPWAAARERDAVPTYIERVDSSANTSPITLDHAAANSS